MSILAAVGLLVIGGIVLAVDLIFVVFVVGMVIAAFWVAVSPSRKTTGEVVEIGKGRTALGTRVRVAYYTPDGRFETDASVQRPRLGEQMPVRYHPGKPDRASATNAGRAWRLLAVMIPAVAVFAALGVGMVLSGVWYFSGSHTQLQGPVGGGSVFLTFAFLCGIGAVNQYAAMLRQRRMVQTDGKILQHVDKPKPGTDEVSGILISFQTADGEEEEFWAQSNVPGKEGDRTAVYYDPNKPAASATVETAKDKRGAALTCTVFTVVFAAVAVFILVALPESAGETPPFSRAEVQDRSSFVVLRVADEDAVALADLYALSALAPAVGGLAPGITVQGLS